MEQVLQVVVNNGLGVASFLALIYFMKTSIQDTNTTLGDISKTMLSIQENMKSMSDEIKELKENKNVK